MALWGQSMFSFKNLPDSVMQLIMIPYAKIDFPELFRLSPIYSGLLLIFYLFFVIMGMRAFF